MYEISPDVIYFEIHNKLNLEDDFRNVRLIQQINLPHGNLRGILQIRYLVYCQYLQQLMEFHISLSCSQELATIYHPEPDESSHTHIIY